MKNKSKDIDNYIREASNLLKEHYNIILNIEHKKRTNAGIKELYLLDLEMMINWLEMLKDELKDDKDG